MGWLFGAVAVAAGVKHGSASEPAAGTEPTGWPTELVQAWMGLVWLKAG
jgi:hypothetical protein